MRNPIVWPNRINMDMAEKHKDGPLKAFARYNDRT